MTKRRQKKWGYGLTIENGRLAFQGACRASDGRKAISPIVAVARKHAHIVSLDQHLAAIAVMLDFVNPVLALWWLIDQGRKLWLDESETGSDAEH
jgi:hypothetical protein